jgi:hypothetical protein
VTSQEIYQTIFTYWQDLYTDETPSLDRCIWRIQESDKIYKYLLTYQTLCIEQEIKI